MRERTRLRGEWGIFHSPCAFPTPSRPVLVIALHFVFAGHAAYLLGHSPRTKTFFYRQKTEAARAIYSFYGTGANKQLSQAQVIQKLYNAVCSRFFPLKMISCGFYEAWTWNRDEKDHDEERKIFSFLISYLLFTLSAVSLQKSAPYCLRVAHLLLALWLVVNTFL